MTALRLGKLPWEWDGCRGGGFGQPWHDMLSAARAKAPLCVAVCVPSLAATVPCPSGLLGSGLNQFSGFPG